MHDSTPNPKQKPQVNQLSLFPGSDYEARHALPLPELIAQGGTDWAAFPLTSHDVEDQRYYAVQDWIIGVAQTDDARIVWAKMKRRYPQLLPSCQQLPYVAKNGRTYQMDFATDETLYKITQHMDASTGIRNHVLDYLAKAGVKLDEYRLNPDQAIMDGLGGIPTHQLRGPHKDDPAWVEARLMGVVSRKEFTEALRDFVHNPDYPRATNEVYLGVFGQLASEIRRVLSVPPKAELRNFMSRPALIAVSYAEAWVSATLVDYGDEIPMEVAAEHIAYIANEVGKTHNKLASSAGVDLLTGQKLLHD
jgi:hypothetical protein